MLLTGTETLHLAAKHGWALPAFAVYNLEMVQAIVAAAEEADRPVLLLAGSSHFHHAGQTALMNMALTAAHSTSAPIGVHLDHCRDLPEMQRCLDAGYSSVMIDGSHLSFEDNVRFTHEAATLAHRAGAWIEAELGAVPGDEDVSTNALPSQTMTDPLPGPRLCRAHRNRCSCSGGRKRARIHSQPGQPRSGTAQRYCGAVPGSPGPARGERTAARTASRRPQLWGCQSQRQR